MTASAPRRGIRFAAFVAGLLLLWLAATLGSAMAIVRWRSAIHLREDRRQAVEAVGMLAERTLDQHMRQAERELGRLRARLEGACPDEAADALRAHLRSQREPLPFSALVLVPSGAPPRVAFDGWADVPDEWFETWPAPPIFPAGWTVAERDGHAFLVHTLPIWDEETGRQVALLHGGISMGGRSAFLAGLLRLTGAAGLAAVRDGRALGSTFSRDGAAFGAGGAAAKACGPSASFVCGMRPFPRMQEDGLWLESCADLSAMVEFEKKLGRDLGGLLLLAAVAACCAAALFARWMTRPAGRLAAYALRAAEDGGSAPPPPCRIREFNVLASVLGNTLDRLREREEDLAITLQSIGEAVMATDVAGRIARMNSAAEQMTGWPLAEARGRPLAEVFAPVDPATRQPLENPALRVLETGAAAELPAPALLVGRDGTERPVADSAAPIRGPDGTLRGAVVIFRDLSRVHQAQEERREAETRLATLGRNLPNGMVYQIVYSPATGQRRFTYVSDSVERLHGLTAVEVLADRWRMYGLIVEEDREELKRTEDRALANLEAFRAEIRMKCPSGETRWFMLSSTPRRAGEEIVWDGLEVDVTERKREELEREMLQAQLSQAQKLESIGRLAGGVAHDFNNMLAVILGTAEMALESVGAEHPLHGDLQEILKAAERSSELTRQLLAFARKQTAVPRVIDVNATVEGMLKMVKRLVGETVELAFRPAVGIGPVKVDPSQVGQILVNLCVNARDAIADEGRIAIETGEAILDGTSGAEPSGVLPGAYVWLAVRDNGSGISPDVLEHVFEPFFSTKVAGQGTGLGLATVYGIAKQNGGFVAVESRPSKGSVFTVYFPWHREAAPPAPPAAARAPSAAGRETILLVEDELAILGMLRAYLERQGYEVLAAFSPVDALRMVREREGPIHLAVTDVVMPEMNGRELAERFGKLRPDVPVLFMSGHTAEVLSRHGVVREDIHFIHKPFSTSAFGAKVRELLAGGAT